MGFQLTPLTSRGMQKAKTVWPKTAAHSAAPEPGDQPPAGSTAGTRGSPVLPSQSERGVQSQPL